MCNVKSSIFSNQEEYGVAGGGVTSNAFPSLGSLESTPQNSSNFTSNNPSKPTPIVPLFSEVATSTPLTLISLDRAIELDHPLKTPHLGTEILGSCNDLLCLYNGEEDVVLWNPSTRKYKKLPVTIMEFQHDGFCVCQFVIYGFVYDEKSDDYKVVRLVQFYADDNDLWEYEVKVYSLKNDSWNRVQDCPYYLRYKRGYGMLASGALRWVVNPKAESDKTNLILAFDLGV
ncbi:F-box protein CPR1 [Fagus crenata]